MSVGGEEVGRTLLDRIIANPNDDELRLVYSDLLLERGDLRGELIQLQLRPSPTRSETDRIVALREAHESRWLGPVGRVTSERVWSRGFLVEAKIEWRRKQDLRAAMGSDAWALVTTARLSRDESDANANANANPNRSASRALVELLSHGGFRSLQSIKEGSVDVARALLHPETDAASVAMSSVRALEIRLHRRDETAVAEAALNGHGLPNLRELSILGLPRDQQELSLVNTNVGRRVESITLHSTMPRLLTWIRGLSYLGRNLREVKLRWFDPRDSRPAARWMLTLKRDTRNDDAWSILEVDGATEFSLQYARRLAGLIGELPPETLTRFVMRLTGETRFSLGYLRAIEQAIGAQTQLTDENVSVPFDRAVARLEDNDDYY